LSSCGATSFNTTNGTSGRKSLHVPGSARGNSHQHPAGARVLPPLIPGSSGNSAVLSRAGPRSGCSLTWRARARFSPPRRGRGSVAGGAAPGGSAPPACPSPSGAPVSWGKALPTPRWGSGSSAPCSVGCRPRLLTCAPSEFVKKSNPPLGNAMFGCRTPPSDGRTCHSRRWGLEKFTNSSGAGGFGLESALVAHRFQDNLAPRNYRMIRV